MTGEPKRDIVTNSTRYSERHYAMLSRSDRLCHSFLAREVCAQRIFYKAVQRLAVMSCDHSGTSVHLGRDANIEAALVGFAGIFADIFTCLNIIFDKISK